MVDRLVWVLSTYEEHGAEDVRVASSPEKARDIIANWYADTIIPPQIKESVERKTMKWLESFDALPEEPVDGVTLGKGWGGLMLHIVKVEG